jgi:hypothetical protein
MIKIVIPGNRCIKAISTSSREIASSETTRMYSCIKTPIFVTTEDLGNSFSKALCSGEVDPLLTYFTSQIT